MRNVIIYCAAILLAAAIPFNIYSSDNKQHSQTDREYWVEQAYRMAKPVLVNLANGTLREKMPVEQFNGSGREEYAHLEAVGRLLCGIAPWFEIDEESISEYELKLRNELLGYTHQGLRNAVDPNSPDYLNFRGWGQPLVDAAFLAQAFLRSPNHLWGELDLQTQSRIIEEMKATRNMRPNYNNWLLFSATVEAFLREFEGTCDLMRTDYAFRQTESWYVGDGQYSDGPVFHNDYYNSFVIQPMLIDAGRVMNHYHKGDPPYSDTQYGKILNRAVRYAEIQERSISPEGTFPVVGRSILYRTGCLQVLAQVSLLKSLPESVTEGQVRAAMTCVMGRMLDAPNTYDSDGWLTMGFCGHQMEAGEYYLCTGSMYLASTIFLPLGLPASDSFWTVQAEPWTTQKAWGGKYFAPDKAISD